MPYATKIKKVTFTANIVQVDLSQGNVALYCFCKLQCLWNRSLGKGNHSLCICTWPEDKILTDSIS